MDETISDRIFLRIAIITAFIGLIALFSLMYFAVIPEKSVDKINDSDIGKKIVLKGFIQNFSHTRDNKTTFIKFVQHCSIDVVSFDNLNFDLTNNATVVIVGKVDEYNGNKELIADRISFEQPEMAEVK